MNSLVRAATVNGPIGRAVMNAAASADGGGPTGGGGDEGAKDSWYRRKADPSAKGTRPASFLPPSLIATWLGPETLAEKIASPPGLTQGRTWACMRILVVVSRTGVGGRTRMGASGGSATGRSL